MDPNFPYAYTLLGHEYVLTEELDKAITAFRNAIRLDPRHYNAWLGFVKNLINIIMFHILFDRSYVKLLSVSLKVRTRNDIFEAGAI